MGTWGRARLRNFSLNGLRMFEAAARHLSFTECAIELAVSQAAVSQQIRRLEEQLKVRLFNREGCRLTLTPSGRELADATTIALSRINRAINRITQSDASGSLTISTLASFAAKWLVPRVATFQAEYPQISLYIHTSELKTVVGKAGIDAAIRLGAKDEDGFHRNHLMDDYMCFVATPKIAFSIERNIQNIYKHTLIVDGSYAFDHNTLDITGAATKKAISLLGLDEGKLRLQSHQRSDTVVFSALAGHGIALTRFSLCMDDLRSGRLEMALDFRPSIETGYSLVYPETQRNCHRLLVFKHWLRRELANSLSPWDTK